MRRALFIALSYQPLALSVALAQSVDLDCLFDKNCRTQSVLPIRQEDKVLPPAPRFALDLNAVPAEFLHIIPGFEKLPHKNQEETKEWVAHINGLIAAKNAGRKGSKIQEWVYDGRPNEPPFACLSYGISTVMDWWSQQCGQQSGGYESSIHGRAETGWDPRLLELEYFYRASTGDASYALFSKQLPIERDPVRRIPVPFSPLGFAKIAVETEGYANPDPYTGQVYAYKAGSTPMEGKYLMLFSNRILNKRTPDKQARVLAEAIDKWGIAYTQLEQTERPRLFGAHAVAVIGYFCMEADGRFLQCAANKNDAEWGAKTFFVVHDSFGNNPASFERSPEGGSAYRAVRIGSIDEAYVFPHPLVVTGIRRDGTINVTNRCGKPVQVEYIRILKKTATTMDVEVAAKRYYGADGKPPVFRVELK